MILSAVWKKIKNKIEKALFNLTNLLHNKEDITILHTFGIDMQGISGLKVFTMQSPPTNKTNIYMYMYAKMKTLKATFKPLIKTNNLSIYFQHNDAVE